VSCHFCRSSGGIVAVKKDSGYIYVFKCSCPAGEWPRNKNYSLWMNRHERDYHADYMGEFKKEDSPTLTSTLIISPPKLEPAIESIERKRIDYKVLKADPKAFEDDADFSPIPPSDIKLAPKAYSENEPPPYPYDLIPDDDCAPF